MVMGSRNFEVDRPRQTVYTKWILTRTLWPKKCHVTGKKIPMYSKAYTNINGKGKDPWWVEQWILPDEFIIARLKGDI